MKNLEHARHEREFALLEKMDDEIVNLLDHCDKNGINIEALVAEYIALDAHDINGHRALLKKAQATLYYRKVQ